MDHSVRREAAGNAAKWRHGRAPLFRNCFCCLQVATKVEGNPITQDEKKGKARLYHGPIFWNYGCFPQTWEDPTVKGDVDVNGAVMSYLEEFESVAVQIVVISFHPPHRHYHHTHSLTHSATHPPPNLLTHPPTHPPTHSLAHSSHMHSLTWRDAMHTSRRRVR